MNPPHPNPWSRLSTLFDTVIDLPPRQREVYIASACAGETDLEQRLRRMLAADAQAESNDFLGSPLLSANLVAWYADETEYEPGSRRFGAYRLIRLIGSGGMGEVHLAERSDGQFEQRVALKLLPQPTPGLIHRFRQERQILARLEHPNIARLLDGGVGEANVPYFAMEYVEGVPIDRFVARSHLGIAATLRLFLMVCDAVQYAHRNLVVHRDIKPSNILVDTAGAPKLLDFGIAKVLQSTLGGDATQTSMRMFTLDYAAPEQLRGEPVTTATDVYALGVVLYELLAGARPYKLKRNDSLQHAILDIEPTAPSAAARRITGSPGRVKQLRGDLDRIVLTALAKQPERRYSSADALAKDILNHLDGKPVAARGDRAMYILKKFILRNKIGVFAATGVALVLAAATGTSLRQAEFARTEAASARASQQFMLNVFTQAEPWQNAGKQPTALELAKASLDKIDVELADQPLARADMYLGLNRLFSVADDVRLSVTAARKAVDALQHMPQPDLERLERSRNALAYALFYSGGYGEAESIAAQLEADPSTLALTRYSVLSLRGTLARTRGQREQHVRIAHEVREAATRLHREKPGELLANLWHEADAQDQIGNLHAALADTLEYEAGSAKLHTPQSPARNSDVRWLLHLAGELDAPEQAFALLQTTLMRTRAMFGASDYTVDGLLFAARAARQAERPDDALSVLAETREIRDKLHSEPVGTADYQAELGLAQLDLGLPVAADNLRAAAAIYGEVGGDHDPRRLALRAALAQLHTRDANVKAEVLDTDLQSREEALLELRAVYAEQLQLGLRELPETAVWLGQSLGGADDAESVIRVALRTLDKQGRPLCSTAFKAHHALARVLAALPIRSDESVAEADTALAQAVALYGKDAAVVAELLREGTDPARNRDARLAQAQDRAAHYERPGLHLVDLAKNALEAVALNIQPVVR